MEIILDELTYDIDMLSPFLKVSFFKLSSTPSCVCYAFIKMQNL
jgi:hypothetical protein